jgi:hypothetical protein
MRFLLCLALLLPAAAFGRVFPLAPYHPTAVITDVDGKPTLVVGATSDGRARVKVGDKTRPLPREAGLRFLRAPEYGPGFVELKNPTDNEPVYGSGSYVRLIATADRAYTNCMAVMVTVDLGGDTVSLGATRIAIKDVSDLKPGKPTEITMQFPARGLAGTRVVMLIFSNGREIRTTHSDSVGALLHQLEVQRFEGLFMAYHDKYKTEEHAAEPYLRFQPVFPADVSLDGLPDEVHLSMTITREGLVDGLQMKEQLPKPAAIAIFRCVGGWLYFPKLSHGDDIESPKVVTLQLHDHPTSPAPAPANAGSKP